MKRVAIIAPTGMLGSMVYNILKDKYRLILIYRSKKNLKVLFQVYGKSKKCKTVQVDLGTIYNDYIHDIKVYNNEIFHLRVDAVINCAGLTKPNSKQHPDLTFFINSAFPHLLAGIYKEKLIQIATDCVFSGEGGAPYNEMSKHDPIDLYGLSKSLGEPAERSLVLRTSIIGPEICDFTLLISWFQKQKEAKGFTTHLWNGVTTKQFARICDTIISQRSKFPKHGLFHVFSNSVNKFQLLQLLAKKYNPECKIRPVAVREVDRRLTTKYSINKLLSIPPLAKQIQDL